MGKILFWAVIIIGALFVARLLNSHQQTRKQASQRQRSASGARGQAKADAQEKMVRCQQCQLYLPQSEATSQDQTHWYCDKHAHLARRANKAG